jgi:hypothetical protein
MGLISDDDDDDDEDDKVAFATATVNLLHI